MTQLHLLRAYVKTCLTGPKVLSLLQLRELFAAKH